MRELASILDRLRGHGWRIAEKHHAQFRLPDSLHARYPHLPDDLEAFLTRVEVCVNLEENAWILCQSDYEGRSGSAFAWDEFEQMSLDAAGDDRELATQIESFWNRHFPFYFSVADRYSYCAVTVSPEDFGTVIEGFEPEFEDAMVLCNSFTEFIETLAWP